MQFNPGLKSARLVRRYKRFLCDVKLPGGEETTIHCPNTGSMKNCCPENARVWYSVSDNPDRKYPFTWELVETPEKEFIGINTNRANKLVIDALNEGKIEGLKRFTRLRSEVPYGKEKSRIDIVLERNDKAKVYIEVKSVTLKEEDGLGYFPDAVSERGQKHLRELISVVRSGDQAVLFFCVQHTGIRKVKPAVHIDPEYARLLGKAVKSGVKVMAYGCDIDEKSISIGRKLRFSV